MHLHTHNGLDIHHHHDDDEDDKMDDNGGEIGRSDNVQGR